MSSLRRRQVILILFPHINQVIRLFKLGERKEHIWIFPRHLALIKTGEIGTGLQHS